MSDIQDDAKQFSEEEKLDFILTYPTRGVFHIDVGNLPKGKAEDLLRRIRKNIGRSIKND